MSGAKLNELSVGQLVDQFLKITLAQYDAEFEPNKYNKLYDRMVEVRGELKRRAGDQRSALVPLFSHQNPQVRFMAAVAMLKLVPDAAQTVLQALADSKEYPQAANAIGILRALEEGRYVPE